MICLGLIMEYWMWCRCCISESVGEIIMTARFVERRMENSISMWKRMYSSEANQQIREALGKGEYRTDYIKAMPVQEEKATAELAPIEESHRTYQRMLSMLTLNRKHQEDLQRRGLKPEQIEAQRYRSVPLFGMKKLVKRLAEEGYMVKGVPGFYRDTDGNWTINFKAENSGILIPIVSLDGFIQGFQIRVDHVTDMKKYR